MVTEHAWFGQEDERRREEKDERKRKYNVKWNDEVCPLNRLLSVAALWLFSPFLCEL